MATRHLSTMSGGELQRLVLARALAQEAPVLLLDEPTSALDLGRRVEALELVDELRVERGLTVISAMHDLTLAAQFADQLALLAGGVIVASGDADDVLEEGSLDVHFGTACASFEPTTANSLSCRAAPTRKEPMADPQRDVPAVPEKLVRADSIVIVNTGDGKGKSSAAFGVMGRAWARGWRVVVVQFVKSGTWQVGEKKLAGHLDIEWHAMGDGFTWESTDLDETIAKGRAAWQLAKEKLASGEYDLVILDEVTYAVSYGWVDVADVVHAISNRAATTIGLLQYWQHLIHVVLGDDQNRQRDGLLGRLALDTVDDRFGRLETHEVGLLHRRGDEVSLLDQVDELRQPVEGNEQGLIGPARRLDGAQRP